MRMLLMIGNNAMSLRELYTMVLDAHPAGWATSFMSGMPGGAESIVGGYDAVIYELGAADSAERVAVVTRLRAAGSQVITHLEGRQASQRSQELAAAGALIVPNPVTASGISETIDALVGRLRSKGGGRRVGVGERFRRIFTG